MATHSSILAWEIPEQRNLAGYSPWGCKELDTIEQLNKAILAGFLAGVSAALTLLKMSNRG